MANACNPRRSAGNGRASPCPPSTSCRSPTCCSASKAQSADRGATAGRDGAAHSASLAYESILTRLRYLRQVGLGYLTLDRSSKTLSGGEVQRVNLTSCLGTSLVDTLFVLDEPSVGLHPRDIDRLIAIIRTLTDAGNTVVVVEHDEAMIRAADHIIEVGPEPGSRGGHIVFKAPARPHSPRGQHHGRLPLRPRVHRSGAGNHGAGRLRPTASGRPGSFTNATKHNLRRSSRSRLPLQRLVCLSGVSGSGQVHLLTTSSTRDCSPSATS
jgi:excinuclease ABC subunit A